MALLNTCKIFDLEQSEEIEREKQKYEKFIKKLKNEEEEENKEYLKEELKEKIEEELNEESKCPFLLCGKKKYVYRSWTHSKEG